MKKESFLKLVERMKGIMRELSSKQESKQGNHDFAIDGRWSSGILVYAFGTPVPRIASTCSDNKALFFGAAVGGPSGVT